MYHRFKALLIFCIVYRVEHVYVYVHAKKYGEEKGIYVRDIGGSMGEVRIRMEKEGWKGISPSSLSLPK